MKIGLVLDDSLDKTDGVQQYVLSLGAWLTGQQHEVHYLVGQTSRHDIPNIHSLSRNVGVSFNGNRLSVPLPTSKRRIRAVLAENFDVLHVQMPYSPWLAGKVLRRAGSDTALLATFHIAPYSRLVTLATRLLAVWSRPSLQRLQQIISVSSAAQQFAMQTYKRPSIVIPNTFDYRRFASAQPLKAYNDELVTIVFLGRLVARKGCQTLLEAVLELQKRSLKSKFRLVVCGGGPLEAELKGYVKAKRLAMVSFVGKVSEADKPRYLASADIAVFPSSGGESFGIVLLEAMASGSAVVLGGDNSGYHTVLTERPELLFPARNSSALADKLGYFLTNTAARRQAAEWGQQAARQYDMPVVGQQILAQYQAVIAKNSHSTA